MPPPLGVVPTCSNCVGSGVKATSCPSTILTGNSCATGTGADPPPPLAISLPPLKILTVPVPCPATVLVLTSPVVPTMVTNLELNYHPP